MSLLLISQKTRLQTRNWSSAYRKLKCDSCSAISTFLLHFVLNLLNAQFGAILTMHLEPASVVYVSRSKYRLRRSMLCAVREFITQFHWVAIWTLVIAKSRQSWNCAAVTKRNEHPPCFTVVSVHFLDSATFRSFCHREMYFKHECRTAK